MDQQHQIPHLFVKIVGAWPSAYFTSRHLWSTFMLRILLNRFVWVAVCGTSQELKSPGVRYHG